MGNTEEKIADVRKPEQTLHSTYTKIEDVLLENLKLLFEALSKRDGTAFDDIVFFVQSLMIYEEDMHYEFAEYRKLLDSALRYRWADVVETSRKIPNSLTKKRMLSANKNVLSWKYRKDELSFLIQLMYKKMILQFRRTTYATLEEVDDDKQDSG